jgi:hypothetical protein
VEEKRETDKRKIGYKSHGLLARTTIEKRKRGRDEGDQ